MSELNEEPNKMTQLKGEPSLPQLRSRSALHSVSDNEGLVHKPGVSGVYFFGQDIMTIPCFRQSCLLGLGGAIPTLLFSFLFTSNAYKSMNRAMLALTVITVPHMLYCQNELDKQTLQLLEVEKSIKQKTQMEYTFHDSVFDKKPEV